ncbi:MAG TPA: TetR/AcrR family transcriptional regulator [Dongiaceae bacterium]|nr:TetR/AcrR family transcriptional regulator [Dongiaceae bacterium]
MEKDKQKQRRKPKQARAVEKYNAILDASARVLQTVGYRNATMSEIHLESGHPYATIYQYFGSKEDVYLAWLERFMEISIFELARLIRNTPKHDLDQYIEVAVRYSLQQILSNRNTLGKLINGMSLISSRLVELMEDRSTQWIEQALGPTIRRSDNPRLLDNMATAARAGNGYWLMLVLNNKREIDIEQETKNFSALIKALLFIR